MVLYLNAVRRIRQIQILAAFEPKENKSMNTKEIFKKRGMANVNKNLESHS